MDDDRTRWDERWSAAESRPATAPPAFGEAIEHFPTSGSAIDVACGDGAHSDWLIQRGLTVVGYDVSDVAVQRARLRFGADDDRAAFVVADLDHGLPPGPAVDLVLCHRFSARGLDAALVERLKPEGVLAVAVLSEVGAGPGRFRARPGELRERFGDVDDLEIVATYEGHGDAWLVARRRG